MTLSIIIVNWNSKDYVRQCLTSLEKYRPSIDFEVIVVDGASFDGCDAMLAANFPSAKYVQSDRNIGFARANNLGVEHSSGEYLMFLNPDTEFLEDSITPLLVQLRALPGAGAIGCKLLNSDGSLQTSCVQSFPTPINQALDSEFLRRKFPKSSLWGMAALYSSSTVAAEIEAVSGACIVSRRAAFDSVGGFSDSYFMYGEDLDLCFKLREGGHPVYYLPSTSIVHHGGGSTKASVSNFSNVMMRESVFRFLRAHRGLVSAALYRLGMAVTALLRLALILPIMAVSRDRMVHHSRDSLKKWKAILRWSFGLESWAREAPL